MIEFNKKEVLQAKLLFSSLYVSRKKWHMLPTRGPVHLLRNIYCMTLFDNENSRAIKKLLSFLKSSLKEEYLRVIITNDEYFLVNSKDILYSLSLKEIENFLSSPEALNFYTHISYLSNSSIYTDMYDPGV